PEDVNFLNGGLAVGDDIGSFHDGSFGYILIRRSSRRMEGTSGNQQAGPERDESAEGDPGQGGGISRDSSGFHIVSFHSGNAPTALVVSTCNKSFTSDSIKSAALGTADWTVPLKPMRPSGAPSSPGSQPKRYRC